jgi:hypothetical protein
VVEEEFDGVEATRTRGGHEGGFAFGLGGIGVGAGFEEFPDDDGVAVFAGCEERRDAVTVGGAGVGSGGEELIHEGGIVLVDGIEECRVGVSREAGRGEDQGE